MLGLSGYVYFLTKYIEFIDTVLLALKNKRISWLHLYHHSAIVVVTWIWLRARVLLLTWLVAINSAVHVSVILFFFNLYFLSLSSTTNK